MPLSMRCVAAPGDDAAALVVAHAFQLATGFHTLRPYPGDAPHANPGDARHPSPGGAPHPDPGDSGIDRRANPTAAGTESG